MLTIQIKNWNNKVVAVINDIFSMQIDDEVNRWWKIKIIFPTEKRLQKEPIVKWYRISVTYWLKIWQVIKLFDGYITDVTVKTTTVQIEWENRLSYLQRRILRADKDYNGTISNLINLVFNELDYTSVLPITLWLNDCQTVITQEFSKGTSFYDIIQACQEKEKDLIVRVLDGVLEVSKNTWNVLDGIWEYDVKNTRATNIADWNRKDSMDKFYTYILTDNWSQNDSDFEDEYKLIFEKYEKDGALTLPSWKALPSVTVSRDTDWWDFNIGDRKNIRLITGYEWLPLEYLWLIQSRKITFDSRSWIKAQIKISEEYKSDTNILDLILVNLRKK